MNFKIHLSQHSGNGKGISPIIAGARENCGSMIKINVTRYPVSHLPGSPLHEVNWLNRLINNRIFIQISNLCRSKNFRIDLFYSIQSYKEIAGCQIEK